jgi:hypothetical protein
VTDEELQEYGVIVDQYLQQPLTVPEEICLKALLDIL